MFARSAKLASRDLAALEGVGFLASSTTLSAFLRDLEAAVAREAAEALIGDFLSLIPTSVGERLTVQALRGEWPTIEDAGPGEADKDEMIGFHSDLARLGARS